MLTLLLCLTTTPIIEAQQGVYFVQKPSVFVTYDSWILTLTVDINSFEPNFQTVRHEIVQFQDAFNMLVLSHNRSVNSRRYLPTMSDRAKLNKVHSDLTVLINGHIATLENEFQDMTSRYSDLLTLAAPVPVRSRNRRGLLPFGGQVLNFLFSVPTQKNLRKLQKALIKINNRQNKVINLVENSLTIINTSHAQIQENRQMVQNLQDITRIFHEEIATIKRTLRIVGFDIFYLHMVNRLNNIFHTVYPLLMRTKFNLIETITNVQSCIQGNLPVALLPPIQLQTILDTIQNNLPEGLYLPHKLNSIDTMSFYKFLHPLALPKSNQIHLIVGIPILSRNSQFNVYQAISLPFISEQLNLSATYVLEAEYMALSQDKTQYSFITKSDKMFCNDGLVCKLDSPLYLSDHYPSCLLGLKQRDSRQIEEHCQLQIDKTPTRPILKYLEFGHWVISSPVKFKLHIICSDSEYLRLIPMGITTFSLENHCRARSDYFITPIYYTGTTDVNKAQQLENEIKLNKVVVDVLNTSQMFREFKSQRRVYERTQKRLQNIDKLPLSHMSYLLGSLNSEPTPLTITTSHFPTSFIILIVVFIVLSTIFPMFLVYRVIRRSGLLSYCKLPLNRDKHQLAGIHVKDCKVEIASGDVENKTPLMKRFGQSTATNS